MKIELSGHTDNKGSATYNLKLSESRAKSVVDFLISTGIEKTRLTFKGYGFLKPISSNETEEGRQQNRRTEFKVLAIDENAIAISSSSTSIPTEQKTTTSAPKLPIEFAVVDKNKDEKISADEIIALIDKFFDGDSDLSFEKINRVINFFFEQE